MEDHLRKSLVSLMLFAGVAFGQEPATQIRQLVNEPTAGMLARGQYEVGMRLFANGGVLSHINVGINDRFLIGISYGGEKILGSGKVNFNPLPGVDVRYRLIDESVPSPAVAIGFNNQGYGRYVKKGKKDTSIVAINRYTQKSLGLFAVASKNYSFAGQLGIHGGINWSVTEKKDKDNQPAFFIGIDKSINKELSGVWEYNLALNDNRKIIGHHRGYMNIGAKFNFNNRVVIDFIMTDILNNSKNVGNYSRELRLSLMNVF